MKKILLLYPIATLTPIFLYLFEKTLPLEILERVTFFPDQIKSSSALETFWCLFLIAIGYFIIKINIIKDYSFITRFNNKALNIFVSYSLIRLFLAIRLKLQFAGFERSTMNLLESTSREGIAGIFITLINAVYPLMVAVVSAGYFSVDSLSISKKQRFRKKTIFLIVLFVFFISSLLFDQVRQSRGNLYLFGTSLFSGYFLTSIRKINAKNLFSNAKRVIWSLLIVLLVGLSLIFSTYFRGIQGIEDADIENLGIEELMFDNNLNQGIIMHDSTLLKAVGGQIVTNNAIKGNLIITSSDDSYLEELLLKTLSLDIASLRDNYCRNYDCTHLFHPYHFIRRLFNFNKERLPMYFLVFDSAPFNSTSHIGSLYVVFNRFLAPIIYLSLLFIHSKFFSSKSFYLQWLSNLNLIHFCFFAYTDNWLITFYPYIAICSGSFLKMIGVKLISVKKL